MTRYKLYFTLLLTFSLSAILCSCDKESKEPDYVPTPIPTPTPDPNPNPTPTQITSNCVYTDNTGQKFVLAEIRDSNYDGDFSFLYDDNGLLTTLTCDNDFFVKIKYNEAKAVWKEDGKSKEITFTLNSEGNIVTLLNEENMYNVEYSQGYIVKINRKGNKDAYDESTFTIEWANGSIENITEKINIHGNHYDTEEYDFLNTYPNLLKQFSFGFQSWLPDEFGLFWLAGLLGKAPDKLPEAVYQTSTCPSSSSSSMDFSKIKYVFDNIGRIYSETCYWGLEIQDGDGATFNYHYRNWN